jgi:hypothetical protein
MQYIVVWPCCIGYASKADVTVYKLDGIEARTREYYNDSTLRLYSLVSTT